MFKSGNVVARLFEREIRSAPPGASVNCARQFYENIVPNCTVYDVDCPDLSFRKFSDDGRYLITFSRNFQDLRVYRPKWFTYSYKGEDDALPPSSRRFESFFILLYTVPLASSDESICKDFFLYMEDQKFGLFATSTAPNQIVGAIPGVPLSERITFYLVRLEDGVTLDEKVFTNDFIYLANNSGVYLYDDLLAVVSLRYQIIHIIQVRASGHLVDVRTIGAFCREDDELFLRSTSSSSPNVDNPQSTFLSGIKQRLLSFIFRSIWNEETDDHLRVQNLKKKFYFHFQDYVELVIIKVHFLDRHHLLIKFGSVDGGIARTGDQQPSFFAVYSMETTEFVAFYQNSAEELYFFYEQFNDHFYATSRSAIHMNFISSHSNNVHAYEQLKSIQSKSTNFSLFVRKMLLPFPFNCQSLSPSPYFDQSLFRYDDKLISATDRHRPATDHPIKFISRRPPHSLKFKIKQGPEAGNADGRVKKLCSFLFHPFLPLVLSVQQTMFLQSSINIHFRQ